MNLIDCLRQLRKFAKANTERYQVFAQSFMLWVKTSTWGSVDELIRETKTTGEVEQVLACFPEASRFAEASRDYIVDGILSDFVRDKNI